MASTTSNFQLLRWLILCIGFTATSVNTLLPVAAIASSESNDPVDSVQTSNRDLINPRELTFQYLPTEQNAAATPEQLDSSGHPIAAIGTPENGDEIHPGVADTNTGQRKKAKKAKKAQKSKQSCEVFFNGPVTANTQFTAVGDYSSKTLIQIFEDETAFDAGAAPLQTIEYSTESAQSITAGDQLGSMTVTRHQERELTFTYLSTQDSDYTNVSTSQTSSHGVITGTLDDDNQAYVVVFNGKGSKCGRVKFKKAKCKKGSEITTQGTTTGGVLTNPINCNADTLTEIFDNDTQVVFVDVSTTYWASSFIYRLVSLQVVRGFPDGYFLPDTHLTNAHFASIVSQAFRVTSVRESVSIRNLSSSYWAYSSIQKAYSMGFINITNNTFNPDQTLTKLDVLVSLARGLGYTQVSSGRSVDEILSVFTDANTIPTEYRVYIAALVEKGVIVNYPNARTLNLTNVISRAETCSLVYQALASLGQVESITSSFLPQ